MFHNRTQANAWAKERRAELGDMGEAFGSITEAERGAVMFWRAFVGSVESTSPPSIYQVLAEFAERWKANRSSVTVAATVDQYEAAKKAEGLRPISLQGIRTRCGRFARAFGERPICSITSGEISDWIMTLEATRQRGKAGAKNAGGANQIGLLAKRNYRLVLSGLFNFAKARGWVKENPVMDSARPKPPKTRPGILRPGEVSRLFAALEVAAAELVPFWAVRFFAGIREQECLRMDWSMIDFANREIHLPDTITKTGHSRTVKIEPALEAFLSPHKQADGPIVNPSEMARRYHLKKALSLLTREDEAAEESGGKMHRPFPVPMPANVARHSFATFHLLAFRHAGETALQLGHGGSPEMLHRHYKGVSTEAEALAFWAIRPAGAVENVIAIKRGESPAVGSISEKTRKRKQ